MSISSASSKRVSPQKGGGPFDSSFVIERGEICGFLKRGGVLKKEMHYISPSRGPWPIVSLAMPGCIDICVNTAHKLLFSLEHSREDFRIATSLRDFRRLSRLKTVESNRCYCDKVESIFALKGIPFCVLEDIYKKLQAKVRLPSGIAFFQLREIPENGDIFRLYNVYRVVGLEISRSRAGARMTIGIIPVFNTEVRLKSLSKNEKAPPDAIDAEILVNGKLRKGPSRHKIKDDDFLKFDGIIDYAIQALSNSKGIAEVRREVLSLFQELSSGESETYAPIVGHLQWRFRARQDRTGLLNGLLKERRQLFDGLALLPDVADEVARLAPFDPTMLSSSEGRSFPRMNLKQKTPDRNRMRIPARVSGRRFGLLSVGNDRRKMKPKRQLSVIAFQRQILAQANVFEANLPRLLKRYKGKFVAIRDGEILGIDSSKEKLKARINKSSGNIQKPLLLQKIEPIDVSVV